MSLARRCLLGTVCRLPHCGAWILSYKGSLMSLQCTDLTLTRYKPANENLEPVYCKPGPPPPTMGKKLFVTLRYQTHPRRRMFATPGYVITAPWLQPAVHLHCTEPLAWHHSCTSLQMPLLSHMKPELSQRMMWQAFLSLFFNFLQSMSAHPVKTSAKLMQGACGG